MTWADIYKKYPEYRDEMTVERERAFVEDCFKCYEQNERFAPKFWSSGGDYKEYVGKPFEVVGRVPEYDDQHKDGVDLECLRCGESASRMKPRLRHIQMRLS